MQDNHRQGESQCQAIRQYKVPILSAIGFLLTYNTVIAIDHFKLPPWQIGETLMNWSLYTADRTTHLKIVAVGLAASFMIAVIGISVRDLNLGTDIITAQTPAVVKAGGPVLFTDRSGPVVR